MGRGRRGSALVSKRVSVTLPPEIVDAPRQLDAIGLLPRGTSASKAYEHIMSVGWNKIMSDVKERAELEAYAAALGEDTEHEATVLALQRLAQKAGIL